MMKKSLIMIPYACGDDGIGVNIKNQDKSFDIYMKNCCGALVSIKNNNKKCDVALVTNVKHIPDEFQRVLSINEIKVFNVNFDYFLFPENENWKLAFYKLCALQSVVENYEEYDYYAYCDSDIVCQSSFDNVWKECKGRILLYDICQGIQIEDYKLFLSEYENYMKKTKAKEDYTCITRYGGEFFAADRESAVLFIEECKNVYDSMIQNSFRTTKGDEFIISIVAERMKHRIKNAGAYVFRFWTGSFRVISSTYKNQEVTVLHVPGEKEKGMIILYNHYWKKGKVPSKKKVWRKLHIIHPSPIVMLKIIVKRIIKQSVYEVI